MTGINPQLNRFKMQQTNNNNKNTESNKNAMSICIPRAFANITEARVRKVFEKLGIFTVARVDMLQRKNEKGDAYQRIFVHIKDWSETADAQKAKERLLEGKELKIVYDDPWFWKVSLNTWTPKPVPVTSLYDRKPRIRLEFEDQETKNVDAAAVLLGSLNISEDQRPYRERRVDPNYCEQDVVQGFRDRRLPAHREQEPIKREKPIVNSLKPLTQPLPIAPGLPEPVKTAPIITAPAVKRDTFLVAKMTHMFNTEITDEIYLANRQRVRELLKDARDIEEDESDPIDYRGDNGTIPAAPKRKPRTIVEPTEQTNIKNESSSEDEETHATLQGDKCRDVRKCFTNGQRIRHTIGNDKTWIGIFDFSKNGIICDTKLYQGRSPLNQFAKTHYEIERKNRVSNVNAWSECECEVNGKWISTYDL